MNHYFRRRSFATACVAVALFGLAACGSENETQLLTSARAFLAKNDGKAAAIQAKVALQKNPQSAEARFLLGDALLRSGDFSGATVELEKSRELRVADNRVVPLLARALAGSLQLKKLTDRFADVALSDPKAAADLKATVSAAYGAQGLLDKSEAAARAALALDPKSDAALLLQARLIAGRGAIDEAMGIVDVVLRDDPKRAAAWLLKGQLLWIGKSDIEGAKKALHSALEADPQFLPAHSTLTDILIQDRDVDGVRAEVAAMKKAAPGGLDTQYYEAQLALVDSDVERARQIVQQLLKLEPENLLVLQLAGRVELERGSLVLAQSHLNKALQLEPNLPQARMGVAQAFSRMGQPAKALAALQPLLLGGAPSAAAFALAGQSYLQTGDFDKAEIFFGKASKADPADPRTRVSLLVTQIGKGNVDAGMAQLDALAAAESTAYADLALISLQMRNGDLTAALKAVDRLQKKWPDRPLPQQLRGTVLQQQGDRVAARAAFEKAVAADPAYFSAVAALAVLDLADNKPDDARKRFEAVLARDPKNYRALISMAELRQRAGAGSAEVTKMLSDVVKLNPSEPTPRLTLIEHLLFEHDNKAAVTAAQDAVATLPDNAPLLDALGRAQLANGDVQQAISTFTRFAEAAPASAQPYLRLADAHLQSKNVTAAAQSLRRALDTVPQLFAAQRGLAQIALAQKRPEDAVAIARTVQKQRPKEAAGFLLEGEIQASQQHWEPAIAAFRKALDRNRVSEMAIRLHAMYAVAGRPADADRFAANWETDNPRDATFQSYLGALAMETRDYPHAEARYRKVLALNADDALAMNNVAWLLLATGKPGALPLAERANQLAADRPAIMDTLAAALAAENQLPKALEWQQKAVDTAPSIPGYRLNLARLLLKSNQTSAARTELEKLAKLGAGFNEQAEVARLLKTM